MEIEISEDLFRSIHYDIDVMYKQIESIKNNLDAIAGKIEDTEETYLTYPILKELDEFINKYKIKKSEEN